MCNLVEGKNNEPGSVRYCRGTLPFVGVREVACERRGESSV